MINTTEDEENDFFFIKKMNTSSRIIIEQVNGSRASHRIAKGYKHKLWFDVTVAKHFLLIKALGTFRPIVVVCGVGEGLREHNSLFLHTLLLKDSYRALNGPYRAWVDPLGPIMNHCKTGMFFLKLIICLFSLNLTIKGCRTW